MIEVQESSGNVYEDLGRPDAEEMQIKAQLAVKIADIIKKRKLTQKDAAAIIGMSQAKISDMSRGRFRGISQAKMLECLVKLGRDVQIVVGPARRTKKPARVDVVFAA